MKNFVARYPLLILIVLLAFAVRLYRLNYPLLDWHSWRQADTASVTREFQKNGIDLLEPKYHDVSSIPSGRDNPAGYRMVELPLVNALIAGLLSIFPSLPLVPTSRMVSILFSLGTLIAIFLLVKEWSGKRVAYLSALTFAVLPYSIYYSRAILPEPAMLFFSTFAIYSFDRWTRIQHAGWYLSSALSLAIALLLKPFVVFLAPVFAVIVWLQFGKNFWKNLWLYLYGLMAVAPLLLWRDWIANYPEGIPASDWLYNGNGIRFRPAWFRWLGYERLTKLMLGFSGLVFLPFGLIDKNKDTLLYLAWWLGIGSYLTVFATGNVQHDYYQIIMLPILSITVGKGVVKFYQFINYQWKKRFYQLPVYSHVTALTLVSCAFLIMIAFSWTQVRGYFNVNHWEYVRAGQIVRDKTPSDALIIAPAMGDTAFLFQTDRRGWPIGSDISDKIDKGATHYLTTSYDDEAKTLEEKYFIIEKTDEHLLLDLTNRREAE